MIHHISVQSQQLSEYSVYSHKKWRAVSGGGGGIMVITGIWISVNGIS